MPHMFESPWFGTPRVGYVFSFGRVSWQRGAPLHVFPDGTIVSACGASSAPWCLFPSCPFDAALLQRYRETETVVRSYILGSSVQCPFTRRIFSLPCVSLHSTVFLVVTSFGIFCNRRARTASQHTDGPSWRVPRGSGRARCFD